VPITLLKGPPPNNTNNIKNHKFIHPAVKTKTFTPRNAFNLMQARMQLQAIDGGERGSRSDGGGEYREALLD